MKANPNDVRLMEYILTWQAAKKIKKPYSGPRLDDIAAFFGLANRSSALWKVRDLEAKFFITYSGRPYLIAVTEHGKKAITQFNRELELLAEELRDGV
jgi:hypothetical protein